MRLLAAALWIAVALSAQTYEIRGTVTEPGGIGVGGVVLKLTHTESGRDTETTTDARGGFYTNIEYPGTYLVYPTGNQPYFQSTQERMSSITVRVDAANPKGTVHLSVVRRGEITGLALDEETRRPIVGAAISLLSAANPYFEEADGVTDANGQFRLSARPGSYIVATRKEPGSRPDNTPRDSGYAATFWPGGFAETKAVAPLQLPSGGIADVGMVLFRKVPLFSMRISIPQGECPGGESVRVSVLQVGTPYPVRSGDVVPCGSKETLHGFDRGAYTLYAVSDWQVEREKAAWAVEPVIVGDNDKEVTLTLTPGVTVEGRIVLPDGVTLASRPTIGVRQTAIVAGLSLPVEQFIAWSSDTAFKLVTWPGPQDLVISGVPPQIYLNEILYNGIPVRGTSIEIRSGDGAHHLELVFDDKATPLSGRLANGLSVFDGYVFLTTNGSPFRMDGTLRANIMPDGQFRFNNVAAGEYRMLAVESPDFRTLADLAASERVSSQGVQITVMEGVAQSVIVPIFNAR